MGTGYVGTSEGKLERGEHNNDAWSGEAKKGQLSEAEGESRSFSTDGSGAALSSGPSRPLGSRGISPQGVL